MKQTFTLFFLLLTMISFGQNLNPYIASQSLQDAVSENPNGYHEVLFLFTDRVDARAMDADFYARNLNLQQRNIELIAALKSKANTVQAPYLQAFEANENIQNVKSFWISNIIYALVKGEELAALSHNTAFDLMDLSQPLRLDEYSCEAVAAPPVPNGTEPGLRAIDADSMWAMGYSGYGRIAFTSDTGVDATHPALIDKYRGNIVPAEQAWYEFDDLSDYPIDCDDHGTHVTGTMVGLDRSTNDTIGVAYNAQWVGTPSIVCSNSGTASNVGAFQWALDPDGDPSTIDDMPDVVNNSWWAPSVNNDCNNIFNDVLDALEATKVAVVFSAGNEGSDAETITNPKNINTTLVNVFCVGAVSSGGINGIADFSSRGPSTCPGEGSLAIKPEVSAPGVSVRSSIPGAGYDFFNGTSMAAPHVSGAILLLREAFPNTTATEVKMALYLSAIDLGNVGEDNTYGMGIINVPAAYDYLIEQGHTPEPPATKERDVIAVNVELYPVACPENFAFALTFENNGVENLTELTIDYTMDGQTITYQWSGDLAPNETSSISFTMDDITPGNHELQVLLTAPNGLVDDRPLNNRIIRRVQIIDSTPLNAYAEGGADAYCDGSEVLLRVDYQSLGSVEVEWYDQAIGGDAIGEGEIFNVGALTETQTFYAEGQLLLPVGKAGVTTAGLATVEQPGLVFDALQDFKLKSALIYFEEPGLRLFTIENADGESFGTKAVNIQGESPQRVNLLFNVPQGNNHRVRLQQGLPILIDVDDVQFPYTLGGVAVIERSLAANTIERFSQYHGIYDWEVEIPEPCGRVPVTVNIVEGDDVPTANFAASTNELDLALLEQEVTFTNNSENVESFVWNFGDGVIDETTESPTHIYSEAGSYFVSLTVFSAEGCSSSFTTEITVTGDFPSSTNNIAIADWNINIFPNPTSDNLTLDFQLNQAEDLSYRLVDIYGRSLIFQESQTYASGQTTIDLSEVATGIYYLIFESEEARMVEKIVVF